MAAAKKAAVQPVQKPTEPNTVATDPVEEVLSVQPELAEQMQHLTRGEKLIRLRQAGLIGFDVQ